MNAKNTSSEDKPRVSKTAFGGWYIVLPVVAAVASAAASRERAIELVGWEVTPLTQVMSAILIGTVVGTLTWTVLAAATGKKKKTDDRSKAVR